jgi:hypothetical protein
LILLGFLCSSKLSVGLFFQRCRPNKRLAIQRGPVDPVFGFLAIALRLPQTFAMVGKRSAQFPIASVQLIGLLPVNLALLHLLAEHIVLGTLPR